MQIQLTWIDPNTGEERHPVLETPVALGREFGIMPGLIDGQRVSRIVLDNPGISDYHVLISINNGNLILVTQNPNSSTLVNGVQVSNSRLLDGDRLQIGAVEIQVNYTSRVANPAASNSGNWVCDRQIGFLFKRPCDRTSRVGCPDCDNQNNRSYTEYSYYSGYGRYSSGWGSSYYLDRDRYSYNPETENVDFTDADNMYLGAEADTDFEQDMGAS